MNMNQKGFANFIVIGIVLVIVLSAAGYFVLNNRSETPTPTPPESLLRVCPEQWIVNRMPITVVKWNVGLNGTPKAREYFIYKGVRRELSEFDINWVKANCSVKPIYPV